jgi:hypothetical protein
MKVSKLTFAALLLLASVPLALAQKETVLRGFNGSPDGSFPVNSRLTFDTSGNLYGMTGEGGATGGNCFTPNGCGVFFKLTPSSHGWTESVLYSFTGGADGATPCGGVFIDQAGNVYRTAANGGAYGYGTVFKLTAAGSGWTGAGLYSFTGDTDGSTPCSDIVADQKGNLFGTASVGGDQGSQCLGYSGCGTVFELTPNSGGGWAFSVLYTFTGAADGGGPGELISDAAGNLYATTWQGGDTNCVSSSGCGTVFRLAFSNGAWTETALHSFSGLGSRTHGDGAFPNARLTFDADGNLYGTTYEGGEDAPMCGLGIFGCGTVFELARDSSGNFAEKVLYRFTGARDGFVPEAPLVFDSKGNLYGTTVEGGGGTRWCYNGCGVVFELTPSALGWKQIVTHTFAGMDGAEPEGGVILAAGGLFGTTYEGGGLSCGGRGCGVIFEIKP